MRCTICLLYLSTSLIAAPVKATLATYEKELDALWSGMDDPDHVVAACAAYRLHKHSFGVEYLARKIKPLGATKERLKSLMQDLNSEEQLVSKSAVEALSTVPPFLELSAPEQIELLRTRDAMSEWVRLCQGIGFSDRVHSIKYVGKTEDGSITFQYEASRGVDTRISTISSSILPVEKWPLWRWNRLHLAVVIMASNRSKTAYRALKDFSEGEARLAITKAAKESMESPPKPPAVPKTLEEFIKAITYDATENLLLLTAVDSQRKLESLIAPKVFAINATKQQQLAWLKDLESDKESIWKVAYEKLSFYHPQLTISIWELNELVTSESGVTRLYGVLASMDTETLKDYRYSSFKIHDGTLLFHSVFGGKSALRLQEIGDLRPASWNFTRLMIPVLKHRGTPEARNLLEEIAKGHPDILPAREAKAVLK